MKSYFRLSERDLALCAVGNDVIMRRCLAIGVLFFLATSAMGIISLGSVSLASLIGLVVGVWGAGWPIRHLRGRARSLRQAVEVALASYLDLVNVLLAGGAGIETALTAAADAGDGWCFDTFRQALARARSSRRTFWVELAEVGNTLGCDVLIEVANTIQLSGQQGARVRASLAVKAAGLRHRHIAELEYRAQQNTEHMGLPMVMIFVSFVLLLGYPAFVTTLGAL